MWIKFTRNNGHYQLLPKNQTKVANYQAAEVESIMLWKPVPNNIAAFLQHCSKGLWTPSRSFVLNCNINRGRLPLYESWWKMCQHYWNLVVAGIEELLLSRGEYSWCWRWWSQKGRLTLQAGRACSLKSESVQPNNGYSWSWKSQLLLFCFCKEYLSFTGEYILCGHDVFSLSSSILLGDVFSFQLWDISFLQVRVVGIIDFSNWALLNFWKWLSS